MERRRLWEKRVIGEVTGDRVTALEVTGDGG